jgi:hypothetical protein
MNDLALCGHGLHDRHAPLDPAREGGEASHFCECFQPSSCAVQGLKDLSCPRVSLVGLLLLLLNSGISFLTLWIE